MRAFLTYRLRRTRRMAATGLAVALSVFFVVLTLLATATLQAHAEASAAERERVADVVVRPNSTGEGSFVDAVAVHRISALGPVASVAVDRTASLGVTWQGGTRVAQVESADTVGRPWYTVVSGRRPGATGEVLLDAVSAAKLHLTVGSRLPVVPDGDAATPTTLVVSGLYRLAGAQPGEPRLLAPDPDVARWGVGRGGRPDPRIRGIEVAGDAGISPEDLAAAVHSAVPHLVVRTGEVETTRLVARAGDHVRALGGIGLAFTAVAALVAAIVIANTFTLLLAQRAHELALMRCLGATRRYLRRVTRIEAAALGGAASAVGAVAAVALGTAGLTVAGLFSATAADLQPAVTPAAVVVPVLLGTILTVVASSAPARRATRVAPVAALRPDSADAVRRTSRLRIGLAIGLATPAAPLLAIAVVGRITAAAGLGGVVLVLAALSATPVLVPAVSRLIGRALHRAGPVVRVAAANTARNARRSAASSTALMVGVLSVTTLAVLTATLQMSAAEGERRTQPVDVVVAAGHGLRPGVLEGVSRIPGIAEAAGLQGIDVRIERDGAPTATTAPSSRESAEPSTVVSGDESQLRRIYRGKLPLTDDVLVGGSAESDPLARLPEGIKDGNRVVLVAGTVRIPLTVRTATGVDAPLVTPAVARRLGQGRAAVMVWARARDDADPSAVAEGLHSVMSATGSGAGFDDTRVSGDGVIVVDYDTGGSLLHRAELDQMLTVAARVATALLAVAILVSLAGIANTLALSVHERTRELGVARALGTTRRQQQAGLLVEALIVSSVGAGLGLVLGIVLGWAGATALIPVPGPVGLPAVPVVHIGTVILLALAAAALASLLPGRRAARISPVEALAST